MLYLGIDQHAMQLTVDLGDEDGNLLLHRQVKTEPESLHKFFRGLRASGSERRLSGGRGSVWFQQSSAGTPPRVRLCSRALGSTGRAEEAQDGSSRCARGLRELLWINRSRILEDERPAKLRVVRPASPEDAADRQLTVLHQRLTKHRTRLINKVKCLIRKWNLQHACPAKGIQTKKARLWLESVSLPDMDRFEMNVLLQQWTLINQHLEQVQEKIKQRQMRQEVAKLLSSIPGLSYFGSLSIACRIGDIRDFRRGSSLANFWGLTPGSRNSGETKISLHITKAGSSLVRFVLGQAVLHVIRRDGWMRKLYQKIKRGRGSKVARVAVNARLAVIIWSMVTYGMPYMTGGPEVIREYLRKHKNFFGETILTAGRVA